MERTLSSRFTRVAKSFGKSIGSIFTKGGPIGIAIGFLTKLLNPLNDIKEAMDRTLQSAGDIVTNAEQFGTTPGQLAKLSALGKAKGIDNPELYQLISKFQGAVARAQQNPNEPSAVRNFVGETDMAEGFFKFIQSLQKMEKSQQILVQQDVFGEKQVLKMASFLQSDFAALLKDVAPQSAEALTKAYKNLDKQSNLQDVLAARRGLEDDVNKGGIINSTMIRSRDKAERAALDKENKQMQSYEALNAVSETLSKVEGLVQEGIIQMGKLINVVAPKVNEIVNYLEKFSKSPLMKGIFNKFGSGD